MAKVTMRMVAKVAEVSPTTVSHVLNETSGTFIADETRQKVLDTARRLGYQKSILSRSIKKSLHHLGIATTVNDAISLDPTAVIFDAFRQYSLGHDYLTVDLPMSAGHGVWTPKSTVDKIKELYQTKLIDGYLINKQYFTNDAIKFLKKAQIPAVLVNGEPYIGQGQTPILPAVVIDNFQAAGVAVEHLVGLGHTDIVMITRPYETIEKLFRPYLVGRLREGFNAAKKSALLSCHEYDVIDGNPAGRNFTCKAVKKLLSRRKRPTAIIVGDDAMGIIVLQYLHTLGVNVPGDISVIVCGGWQNVLNLWPVEITATHAPLHYSGEKAAEMLIKIIEERPTLEPEVLILPTELRSGETTGPAKK